MAAAPRRIIGRVIAGIAVMMVVLGALVAASARTVTSADMRFSLQPGDLVWVLALPGDTVRKADVVLVDDPLDPGRRVLRRVVAMPGDKVRVDDSAVRVNGKRIRQTEMGDLPGHRVRKEVIWSKPPARANAYFTELVVPEVPWTSEGVITVPEGHYYVLADARDAAVDSRWWGPVPESAVHGMVRARYLTPDAWREDALALMIPEE